MSEYPQIIGEVPIPDEKFKYNKARFARKTIQELKPGMAKVIEFESKKAAQDMRSMFYSMAIIHFGESGHIASTITENIMYIWLTDQNPIPVDMNINRISEMKGNQQ